MKKTISIIAVALAVAGMGAAMMAPISSAQADGFGITPPYVTNDQLAQNSHYEQVITLVRSDPTDDLQAKVSVNVPGADSWISIDRGTQFVLPAGTQQEPMIVSVNVPSNAKIGSYTGNIQVVVSPMAGPAKGTVGITIGAQIEVNLNVVSDKVAKLSVRRVTMTNTEAGHALWWMNFPGKILFAMDMYNSGNIAGAPSRVELQYQEYLTGKILETEQNSNGLDSVRPFDTKTVTAEVPTYLPQGSYRVFYQIFGAQNAGVIGQGTLDLAVLPPGTLTGYKGYGFWGISWSEKFMTFGVIILILAALYGIFIGVRFLLRKWRGRGNDRIFSSPPPPPYR
ncbi:MAG: hypothetical protein WCF77_00430 [Minisyncoccia bacterium]